MKTKNAVIIVRLVALMLTSSATLLGGYLSKCIPDPGVYTSNGSSRDKGALCTTTVSTCNRCSDGWWQCFGESQGACTVTEMTGYPSGSVCIVTKTTTSSSVMRCVF